jgi:hypothetical protein
MNYCQRCVMFSIYAFINVWHNAKKNDHKKNDHKKNDHKKNDHKKNDHKQAV